MAMSLMPDHADKKPAHDVLGLLKFSTADRPVVERGEWWREVICRQYAHVDITSRIDDRFYGETLIVPLDAMQLSKIRSSAISIKKRPNDDSPDGQDAYFVAVLLSGQYRLEQAGREAFLQPGDMVMYDATRNHQIQCPTDCAKLIYAIPRTRLKNRFAAVDAYSAIRIPGDQGVAAVTANFLRSYADQAGQLRPQDHACLCDSAFELLTLTLDSIKPMGLARPSSQAFALNRVKAFIEQHLPNPELNTHMVAKGVGLSSRYINKLFAEEDTSLMRYVLNRRLAHCQQDLLDGIGSSSRISDIAFRWGFNDLSHFSRAFKQRFDCSPRDFRRNHLF